MDEKYAAIRKDLEAARNRLDDGLRSDRQIAYILDHAIEVAAHLEFRRLTNVVEFPVRSATKLVLIDREPKLSR